MNILPEEHVLSESDILIQKSIPTSEFKTRFKSNEAKIDKWKKEREGFVRMGDNVERIRRDVRIESAIKKRREINQIIAYRQVNSK